MAKRNKVNEARIQRAVSGLQIPMLIIPKLYAYAESLIASGADDIALAHGIRSYLEGK